MLPLGSEGFKFQVWFYHLTVALIWSKSSMSTK